MAIFVLPVSGCLWRWREERKRGWSGAELHLQFMTGFSHILFSLCVLVVLGLAMAILLLPVLLKRRVVRKRRWSGAELHV